jgi:hypothetical protein
MRRSLRSLATHAALLVAGSSSGCLEELDPPESGAPFLPLPCGDGIDLPLSRLERPVDSLEAGHASPSQVIVDLHVGETCGGAQVPADCMSKRASLLAGLGRSEGRCESVCTDESYILTTEGDEVHLYEQSPETFRALLGAIDTVQEVAFVLGYGRGSSSCDFINTRFPIDYRVVPDGIQIRTVEYAWTCPEVVQRVVRLVKPDATVHEVYTEPQSLGLDDCELSIQ